MLADRKRLGAQSLSGFRGIFAIVHAHRREVHADPVLGRPTRWLGKRRSIIGYPPAHGCDGTGGKRMPAERGPDQRAGLSAEGHPVRLMLSRARPLDGT
jgi:hypothetical protein